MKTKFTMFRRGEVFYMQDSTTGKQTSLRTKDETEAKSLHPTQRGESFTGFGKRPDLTPAHQLDLHMGITIKTSRKRIKPTSGKDSIINLL